MYMFSSFPLTLYCLLYQEEIRFCECPELIASMLFMEVMEDNEAIVICGFEQFSAHRGYSTDLEYKGNFKDTAQVRVGGKDGLVIG